MVHSDRRSTRSVSLKPVRPGGDRAVFLTDPGFGGVFEGYGFEECQVNLSEPLPAQEMAKYWSDFINAHILNFNKTPYDQIDTDKKMHQRLDSTREHMQFRDGIQKAASLLGELLDG